MKEGESAQETDTYKQQKFGTPSYLSDIKPVNTNQSSQMSVSKFNYNTSDNNLLKMNNISSFSNYIN